MGSIKRRRNADVVLSYEDAKRLQDNYSRTADSWRYRWMGINATGLQKDPHSEGWSVAIIVNRRVQALIATILAKRLIPGAPFEIQILGPAMLL